MIDVFISYARDDDKGPPGSSPRVKTFHEVLERSFRARTTQAVQIWRDPKIEPGENWREEIWENLLQARTLVPIFSPSYLRSEIGLRELKDFYNAALKKGDLKVNGKYRIFPVFLSPCSKEDRRNALQDEALCRELEGIQETRLYDEGKEGVQVNWLFDSEDMKRFCKPVERLAQTMVGVLELLSNSGQVSDEIPPENYVFLAETTGDFESERESLADALRGEHFRVLPEGKLPQDPRGFQAAVQEALRRCCFSIHLIGVNYGDSLEEEGLSCVQMQYDAAASSGSHSDRRRIVWFRRPKRATDPRHAAFIQRLDTDTGTVFLEDTPQNPKTIEYVGMVLKDRVAEVRKQKPAIYLARTTSDLDEARKQLARKLQAAHYPLLPEAEPALRRGELEYQIESDLRKCRFSVHLIGSKYGPVPEDAALSVCELEHDLAIKRSASQDLTQLVCVASDPVVADSRQSAFINRLHSEPQGWMERVRREPADKLGRRVFDKIVELHQAFAAGKPEKSKPTLYLVYDRRDLEAPILSSMIDFISEQKILVRQPEFDRDEPEMLERHYANLCESDATLIYWSAGGPEWIWAKLTDLQRALGLDGAVPGIGRALYVRGRELPGWHEPASRFTRVATIEDLIPSAAGVRTATLPGKDAPEMVPLGMDVGSVPTGTGEVDGQVLVMVEKAESNEFSGETLEPFLQMLRPHP